MGLIGDRYVHSIERPMALGNVGMNILRSGAYKKERDFQMPPSLNKYRNLF